jgi:hypothetical protein
MRFHVIEPEIEVVYPPKLVFDDEKNGEQTKMGK